MTSGLRKAVSGTGESGLKVTVGVLIVVEDADDLSRFYYEMPVIIGEKVTLA